MVIGMAKLPKASVELPELAAIAWPSVTLLGSNPPMIWPKVESPGVSSTIVTQVALPNPVISLRPSMVGVAVVTIGVPSAAVPEVSVESIGDRAGEEHRRQVDGEFALAVGRGHQQVGVRGGRGIGGVVRAGQVGHARVGVDVAQREAQRGDADVGQVAAVATAPKVVLGKRTRSGRCRATGRRPSWRRRTGPGGSPG